MHPTLAMLERHGDDINSASCTFFDSPENTPFADINRYDLRHHRANLCSIENDLFQLSALNVLFYPKAKERLTWWLNQLLPLIGPNKRLWIVGENDAGIKSLAKRLKGIATVEKVDSARHCVLFEVTSVEKVVHVNPWQTYKVDDLDICALPGVFSAHKLDAGSRVLLPYLSGLSGQVLEMGCGAGVLSAYVLANNPNVTVSTYDIDLLAVRSTIQTLQHNKLSDRAKVYWADDLSQLPAKTYDVVLTNPPFHRGVKTSYAETEAFFQLAGKQLKANGQLLWVANDFLNYQDALKPLFTSVTECAYKDGFRVFKALK